MSDRTLVHVARVRVRWGDQDALGHVNAATYFTYFEQARADWMRAHGLFIQTDQGPVLARTACNYRRPVFYPDEVSVEIHTDPPGRSSLLTTYRVLNGDGELCAEGEGLVVWYDFARGRPIPFPSEMIETLLRPYEAR